MLFCLFEVEASDWSFVRKPRFVSVLIEVQVLSNREHLYVLMCHGLATNDHIFPLRSNGQLESTYLPQAREHRSILEYLAGVLEFSAVHIYALENFLRFQGSTCVLEVVVDKFYSHLLILTVDLYRP